MIKRWQVVTKAVKSVPNMTGDKSGLTTIEADDNGVKITHYAKVHKAAIDLFGGDVETTQTWMERPVRGLGNKRSVDMLDTATDTKVVLNLIGCLEHGIFV